jgi:hypothetical protein
MDLKFLSNEQKMWRENVNPNYFSYDFFLQSKEKLNWFEVLVWALAVLMMAVLCLPGLYTFLSLIK